MSEHTTLEIFLITSYRQLRSNISSLKARPFTSAAISQWQSHLIIGPFEDIADPNRMIEHPCSTAQLGNGYIITCGADLRPDNVEDRDRLSKASIVRLDDKPPRDVIPAKTIFSSTLIAVVRCKSWLLFVDESKRIHLSRILSPTLISSVIEVPPHRVSSRVNLFVAQRVHT